MLCLPCSRLEKFSGRANPNVRYPRLDDEFFHRIDSEGKAYLLGWIASDGSVTKGTISLYVHPKDAAVVDVWGGILDAALPRRSLRNLVGLTISSQRVVRDVCRLLDIVPGRKSKIVAFPEMETDELRWAFVRGFFDGDGSINRPTQSRGPRCNIVTGSKNFRDAFRAWCPIRASYSNDHIEFGGNHALDFLGRLYDRASYRLPRKYDLYRDWATWVPSLSGAATHGGGLSFRWVKTDPNARAPSKTRASDSGYDLTILRKVKQAGAVEFFDTGIKIQPDFGWYFDVVARSSLTKTGYMLANAVGVIDRTYVGSVLVPLIKVDPSAPDIGLPATVVQLIPRPIVHMQIEEVAELEGTERGGGGFGSTEGRGFSN